MTKDPNKGTEREDGDDFEGIEQVDDEERERIWEREDALEEDDSEEFEDEDYEDDGEEGDLEELPF